MATTDLALEARARRAYEWGRVRASLRLAPVVFAGAAAALACGRPLWSTCAVAGVLLPLALGLSIGGGTGGRAVIPGLVAGTVALACPVLMHTVGHACLGPACMTLGIPACIVGGAAAGALIASRAAREESGGRFLVAALSVAGLMGALGCSLAGAAGVLGMLAGLALTSAPILKWGHPT
ncbi:MAG: hypothetical protein ACM3PC_07710 [Deltaproteobacteria bacterium]